MLAGKGVFWMGLTVILISFLNEIGVGLGPVLGAAGITGVAIGFAAQTSVSNMISGLFLIAEAPFEVDHVITVEGVTGQVLSIDLLSIKIRTFDNRFVRIPNETILKTNVTNLSRYPIRRVDVDVGVAYKEDLDHVKDVLLDTARRTPKALVHPQPMVQFKAFGSSSVDLVICVWSMQDDILDVRAELMTRIKKRFDAEKIEIPFPHLSIYAGEATRPIPVQTAGAPAPQAGSGTGRASE
jgi:small-conductance mechanosensitive channel